MLSLHPSLSFTMELPVDDRIPFIGIEIFKNGTNLETQVFRKSTNTGALLHFHSRTDKRYKYELLTKCEVKMAGYWPSSFFVCLWTETKSNHQRPGFPMVKMSLWDRANLH